MSVPNQNALNSEGTGTAQEDATPDTSRLVSQIKNRGIIIDTIGADLFEKCLIVLGKIIKPKDIQFASALPNTGVCVFLSNGELVERVLKTCPTITVRKKISYVRPLVARHKKISLSPVWPYIPNELIRKKLVNCNIQSTSGIYFVKAGIATPGFAHVMNFQREFYIKLEDSTKLPQPFCVSCDNKKYTMNVIDEGTNCVSCSKVHLATGCPCTGNKARVCTFKHQETTSGADSSVESLDVIIQHEPTDLLNIIFAAGTS